MTKQDPVFILTKDGLYWLQEVPVKSTFQKCAEFMQLPTHEKQQIANKFEVQTTYYQDGKTIQDSDKDLIKDIAERGKKDEFFSIVGEHFKSYHVRAYDRPSDYELSIEKALIKIGNDEQVLQRMETLKFDTLHTLQGSFEVEIKEQNISSSNSVKGYTIQLAFFSLLESKPKEESQEEIWDELMTEWEQASLNLQSPHILPYLKSKFLIQRKPDES
jgi:hypothetical protein